MSRAKLKAIDLFSGCGGLSLGLKNAGYRVLLAIDSDPLATATYKLNHRGTRHVSKDIRQLPPAKTMQLLGLEPGELDLLAGCPPCQGFSRIRTLNGRREGDEEKNDLVWSFLDYVVAFQPRAIMLENVPGLSKDARLASIKEQLSRLDYRFADGVLNASDYGVPQNRRRFVLLAARQFQPRLADQQPNKPTVASALKGLRPKGTARDPLHDYEEARAERVRQIIAAIPKDGGSRSTLPDNLVLPCHRKSDGFKDVYGRMRWAGPAPTITGGCINPSKGRFLHPEEDRAITLREAAVLQGFPPEYRFDLSRGRYPAAQMIGNAFPPKFAELHARSLAKGLRHSRKAESPST